MTLLLENVTFGYPRTNRPVLSEVSLEVTPGAVVGLAGPSGRGKSTLLKIAALVLAPDGGRVLLGGKPVSRAGFAVPSRVRRRIGYVLQSPRAATDPRLSLRHIISEPLSHARGRRTPRPVEHTRRIEELAELAQLTGDLLDRLPHQVSDGQLQRACLARALSLDPAVLLCDEPTAMLDAPTTAVIMSIIAERASSGAAVLIASHDRALLAAVGAATVYELGPTAP